MTVPAYPIARAAAFRIHERFARLLAAAPERTPRYLVEVETLEAAINVAFWASLRREEGITPRVSLAFVRQEQIARPLLLNPPILLTAQSLTRMAPAVYRPGIHLGVSLDSKDLTAWGATHHLPPYSLVLEIVAPGLMVLKYSRPAEWGKFINIAVIQSDEIKVIDQRAASMPDCPALLTPLLGLESQFRSEDSASALVQLAVSMRAHGRGGALLVVPAGTETWRESILSPMSYSVSPPFAALTDQAPEAIRRDIDGVAGLTAVDGATVMNDQFEVLAFGAKIVRRRGSPVVNQLTVTEPIEGSVAAIVEPSQLGGTRHLSAAQFTQDQPEALAMVASQDGRFTVFGWSPCEGRVHALRVETLLL